MDERELAAEYFQEGYSCSQSVVLAFAEELGVDPEVALRMASGFGGGMGRTGNTCGAVSGAMMVIGLRDGYISPADKENKEKVYHLVARIHQLFREKYGATDCTTLLGHAIGNPVEQQKAREEGLFKTRCPLFVQDAVTILLSLSQS
jgi:C_GCAxxG_C_C family probable redox protein